MLDILFELPEQSGGSKYLITDEIVPRPTASLPDAGTDEQERLTRHLVELDL